MSNELPATSGGERMSQQDYEGQQQQRTLVKAGKYLAKPIDWAFEKNKKGNQQLAVVFEFVEENKVRYLTWYGHLTEASIERTLDTLITLGCSTLDDALINKGREGGALDATKQVEIVVNHETYEGKTNARVAWVNDPGGRLNKNRSSDAEVKQAVPNFAAMMKDALNKRGATSKQQQGSLPPQSDVEVPF